MKKQFDVLSSISVKIFLPVFFVMLFFTSQISFAQQNFNRIIIPINTSWKFTSKPVADVFRADYEDSQWEDVNIPHCYNNTDPYDDNNDYYRGITWYRKKLKLNSTYKNKKIYIVFDGVNQIADVYANGAFAGRHKGGYTAFTIDITPFVKTDGSDNVLAVQVNNAPDMFIAPLDVGYTIYGGIYRNVNLLITDSVHFSLDNFGSNGVFVKPSFTNNMINVKVKGELSNETIQKKQVEIKCSLFDSTHQLVSTSSNSYFVQPNQNSFSFESQLEKNLNPVLWSPENPYLYSLTTQILENGKVIDQLTHPIAFKTIRFTSDSGFFLNGKKYILKGTNRHQDMMSKGSALTQEDHEKDLQLIKKMGCNFLRLAHYPQDPYVLKRANELGLLIWEEIPLVNYMNINNEFLQNCSNMLKEMIRQHYNNPSIILWGSMNEIFLNDYYNKRTQKIQDSLYGENVRAYETILDSVVRTEDPSRYSTLAMHMSSDYDKYKIDIIPQVAGYNIYNGWYSGKVEEFGKTFDKKHESKPNQIILVSEYGAESDASVNTEKPTRLDNTGQYQRYFHESYLSQIKKRNYFAGTAIWNQFDFGNPNIGGTISNINHKGMCTWDRKPKDAFYLYKANWNEEPMVYIASRDWPIRAGYLGDSSTIDVYSNGKRVSLFLNGKEISSKFINDVCKAAWQVVLKNGTNVVVAKSFFNKKTISDTFSIIYNAYAKEFTSNLPTTSSKSLLPSLFINCGSNAQFKDDQKNIWLEDKAYTKGSFGYINGEPSFISLKGKITNTDKQPLLYTYLNDIKEYKLDVPQGSYSITMFFAEPEYHEAGKRVFEVSINQTKVLSNLDLYKEAGYCTSYSKKLIINVKENEGLTIKFEALKGKAIINGLQIEKTN